MAMASPLSSLSPLPQGSPVGILGGGQLGRLLALEAAKLGHDVHVFTPYGDDPALRVCAQGHVAAWTDTDAVARFARACALVTLEFENVPLAVIDTITQAGTPVLPGRRSLEISQDRVTEKTFLNAIGIPTVAFVAIDSPADLVPALHAFGGHAILKRRREGYDGKGQRRLRPDDDPHAAWQALGAAPCILEAIAPFAFEVSALIARAPDGSHALWDCPRNDHGEGILQRSRVPSGLPASLEAQAHAHAHRLADALGHVGVLALEFFVMPDGTLLANEFAPRVHNSGHWTPEACRTGQFAQHMRAVCGWPLGDTTRHSDALMENLIGESVAEAPARAGPQTHLTLYGKREARPGRKMGHTVRLG
jgi:5-(carboxyamino)imidazole ribonucleotide synthase